MANSTVADSLLAIDIGTVNTRAILFDVVDGVYRFLAMGSSPTTAKAPYHDIREGIHIALTQLQEITGRTIMGVDQQIILPSTTDGSGVDRCVVTTSVGEPLKLVAVGLLEDISVQSAISLASTTYAQVVDTLSLNDRRKVAARLDTIVRLRPDVVVVAGGTDGGASQSVLGILESIGLACQFLPENQRPEVLYAGNEKLADQVKESLALPSFHVAPNIRPTLDVEQLEPAQTVLDQIYRNVRVKGMPGMQQMDLWTGGHWMPTASAYGRMIRLLSRVYSASRAALGVDVGASATTIAAAFDGELALGVYPQFGLGETINGLLNHTSLAEISRWIDIEVTDDALRDYIQNKALYPTSVPGTPTDLIIEQALARQLISLSLRRLNSRFPAQASRIQWNLMPYVNPIVGSGAVLVNAPSYAHAVLMLLDAIQPVGVTRLMLDQNELSAVLGAAAMINAALTVQVFETGSYITLGTVASPIGRAERGAPVLQVKVSSESGYSSTTEVKFGAIEVIPLPAGQPASVSFQPYHRFDMGKGPGRAVKVDNMVSGLYGIIVDARGRPLQIPPELPKRAELMRKWLASFEH